MWDCGCKCEWAWAFGSVGVGMGVSVGMSVPVRGVQRGFVSGWGLQTSDLSLLMMPATPDSVALYAKSREIWEDCTTVCAGDCAEDCTEDCSGDLRRLHGRLHGGT